MELKSLDTALQLLSCFTSAAPHLGVREISKELGISPSAAHRTLSTFQKHGFVDQCPDTKKYRLGIRLWELGVLFREQFKLNEVVQSSLEDMARRTGESVYLTFRDNAEAVCVQIAESAESVKLSIRLGERTPLFAGSRGRVMLAHLPEAQRAIIRASIKTDVIALTSLIDVNTEDELGRVRRDGYCISRSERVVGVVGLSLPIFVNGSVSASVTLGGPEPRLSDSKIADSIAPMRELAGVIQHHLQNFG